MSNGTNAKPSMPGMPQAPDYMGLANQQAASQGNLLNQQTVLNRPNVSTPMGSWTWSGLPSYEAPNYQGGGAGGSGGSGELGIQDMLNGGSGKMDNPNAMADPNAPTNPTATFQFSPEQQALYNQGLDISGGMNRAALDRINQGISGQSVEDALYGRYTSRLDPQWNQRQDQLRTQLYNQGLREGDAAYTQQMQNFGQSRNDAYENAMRQAIAGGDQSAIQQTSIINMLRGGNSPQVPQQPSWSPSGLGQSPDIIGAANANAAYQSQNNPLAYAAALAPYAFMLSDARLKEEIHYLDAEALPGVRWATWKWKAGGRGHGVIAQDVEKVRPDLVMRGNDGFLRVDYSRIGA